MRLLCFLGWIIFLSGCASNASDQAKLYMQNVVAISASHQDSGKEYGFGFITGARSGQFYVVTAAHVVEAVHEAQGQIILHFHNMHKGYKAKIIRLFKEDDVALLEVDVPEGGFEWNPSCLGTAEEEDEVVFIGREQKWYIPKGNQTGIINSISNDQIIADINSIKVGSSGGPLINDIGIIGMVQTDSDITSSALTIERIQELLEEVDYFFELEAPGVFRAKKSESSNLSLETKAYTKAQESDNIRAYENFLKVYPDGRLAKAAQDRINKIKSSTKYWNEEWVKALEEVNRTQKKVRTYLDNLVEKEWTLIKDQNESYQEIIGSKLLYRSFKNLVDSMEVSSKEKHHQEIDEIVTEIRTLAQPSNRSENIDIDEEIESAKSKIYAVQSKFEDYIAGLGEEILGRKLIFEEGLKFQEAFKALEENRKRLRNMFLEIKRQANKSLFAYTTTHNMRLRDELRTNLQKFKNAFQGDSQQQYQVDEILNRLGKKVRISHYVYIIDCFKSTTCKKSGGSDFKVSEFMRAVDELNEIAENKDFALTVPQVKELKGYLNKI